MFLCDRDVVIANGVRSLWPRFRIADRDSVDAVLRT